MNGKYDNSFSPEVNEILNIKCQNETTTKQGIILPKDVILCIFNNINSSLIKKIISNFNLNYKQMLEEISIIGINSNKLNRKVKNNQLNTNGRDASTEYLLQNADKLVSKIGHVFIDTEHIIYAYLSYKGKNVLIAPITNILHKYGLNEKQFRSDFISSPKSNNKMDGDQNDNSSGDVLSDLLKTRQMKNQDLVQLYEKTKANLISFGYIENINEKVKTSNEKYIGREDEINRCIQILSRKKKRNVIVIGEPGTGKTSFVEGIARRINEKLVPSKFYDTEILSINFGNMVAGTKYRGQFEERMKWVIQLVEYANKINKKLILFIDEIHTLVNAGAAEGSISGGAILKPKLSSDEIHCIGATTPEDYRKHLTKDEALARRFSKLYLDEPQIEEVHNIVNNIKDEYEKFHNVTVDNDALDEIVNLSDRYIKDRFFPDKALDILDESCSKVVLNNGTTVSVDTIEKIVSDRTGIPITVVSGEEKEILRHLEGDIKEIVVSQEGAIKKVCKSVRKSRIGLKDENKPIGVYLFLGPTGVGKTLLSKTLSEKLFGKNKIIRLDMSEYMDKTSVNKITGSPAGYVGYEEGSAFLEQVRQKPYSVILLDEIEKAHKDVLNVFLGIFDEGRLTDSCGRLCDFRNTIIIMTSNLATERLKKNKFLGFNKHNVSSDKEIEDYLIEKVEGYFSPEFIGRITDIVIFNELTKDDARNIFNIEFNKIKKRIKKVGYSIEITEEALSFMCDRGYSEKYGARPMGKIISNLIEDPITDLIIDTGAKKGSIVSISRATDKEELAFQLKNSKE